MRFLIWRVLSFILSVLLLSSLAVAEEFVPDFLLKKPASATSGELYIIGGKDYGENRAIDRVFVGPSSNPQGVLSPAKFRIYDTLRGNGYSVSGLQIDAREPTLIVHEIPGSPPSAELVYSPAVREPLEVMNARRVHALYSLESGAYVFVGGPLRQSTTTKEDYTVLIGRPGNMQEVPVNELRKYRSGVGSMQVRLSDGSQFMLPRYGRRNEPSSLLIAGESQTVLALTAVSPTVEKLVELGVDLAPYELLLRLLPSSCLPKIRDAVSVADLVK